MISQRMAKLREGSTAPSLGTRSRTWPYEARTSKSLPRYFLMVFALAGDSTMTRLVLMKNETAEGPRGWEFEASGEVSMQRFGTLLEHQVLHACVRLLLPGLGEQHHEHHPLHLVDVDAVGLERHEPVDDDFALGARQDADVLQVQDVAAAVGVQARHLVAAEHADRARRGRAARTVAGRE